MKNIEIPFEIPVGYEIDLENTNLKEGKIIAKEIKKPLPKTWEEIKPNAPLEYSYLTDDFLKAERAIRKLFILREVYRNGWKPDWKTDEHSKYIIEFSRDEIRKNAYQVNNEFLSFQSREIRDEFLKNFRDLIETARPLIS